VSRALRGSYEISSETKKLVLEYAEKINYRPNPIALSLKERRSRSIGVIVCEIANNFFSQAINGIESIAYNRGYHVIISQSHESFERSRTPTNPASRSVDDCWCRWPVKRPISPAPLNYEKVAGVFFDRICEIETHQVVVNNYKVRMVSPPPVNNG
jgi:LacI family transcriptional regulator